MLQLNKIISSFQGIVNVVVVIRTVKLYFRKLKETEGSINSKGHIDKVLSRSRLKPSEKKKTVDYFGGNKFVAYPQTS